MGYISSSPLWRGRLGGGGYVLLGFFLLLPGCHRAAPAGEAKPEEAAAPVVAVEMATITTGEMQTVVTAQGTLAPGQGAIARVAAVAPGRVASVLVREGERVTQGQVVARIDNRTTAAQAKSAAYALTTAEAQARQAELSAQAVQSDQKSGVNLAQLALRAAEVDREGNIEQARIGVQSAETDLQKTRAGARPQEIAQAEQTIAQATATRARADTEMQRVRYLNDKGISPKRAVDDAATALAVADAALETAKQQASLTKSGARPEDLRAAELRVSQAKETLDDVTKSGDAKVQSAKAAVHQAEQAALNVAAKRQEAAAARQSVAQKQADYAAAAATALTSEIRAPLTGIVTKRSLNTGDLADTTNPILEITATQSLNLAANLPAEAGAKVRAGMTAQLTSTDTAGTAAFGTVLTVGQIDPQTNLLTVRIAVPNAGGKWRVGEFTTAEIVLRNEPHALLAPKTAVVSRDGKPVVYVVGSDDTAHQREVTTGAERNGFIEIVRGVKAGERVAVLGSYELSDGTKVRDAAKASAEAPDANKKDAPAAEK